MNIKDPQRVSKNLDAAVEALQTAHREQRYGGEPSHMDFYAWGWALSEVAAQLAAVVALLERQVAEHPDRSELRDDDLMDPAERIARCTARLGQVAVALGTASSTARAYHNEMSHVAVDDDRWEEE